MAYIGRTKTPAPLTSADIPDGIVTAADLAPNSVDTSEIADSVTLVTPNIGTPSAGVVTNLSGVLPVEVTGGSGLTDYPSRIDVYRYEVDINENHTGNTNWTQISSVLDRSFTIAAGTQILVTLTNFSVHQVGSGSGNIRMRVYDDTNEKQLAVNFENTGTVSSGDLSIPFTCASGTVYVKFYFHTSNSSGTTYFNSNYDSDAAQSNPGPACLIINKDINSITTYTS